MTFVLPPRRLTIALLGLACTLMISSGALAAVTTMPLTSKLAAMDQQLRSSPFGRPLTLESTETADGLKGDVFAVVDQPIKKVVESLRQPTQLCEAMLLHINNRACKVSRRDGSIDVITLSVVRKYDQSADSAFVLPFSYRLMQSTPQHLEVQLDSAAGPMGTSNYRISIEAVAADDRRSFLHFSYSYDEGVFARTAMKAYLATFGRSKVGFTAVGKASDGTVELIRGTRGLVERNAMRYFLAVDAYLSADAAVTRRQAWFSATEQYPLQLHEIDGATYLELKAEDARR
jgi:hypothetical protein